MDNSCRFAQVAIKTRRHGQGGRHNELFCFIIARGCFSHRSRNLSRRAELVSARLLTRDLINDTNNALAPSIFCLGEQEGSSRYYGLNNASSMSWKAA